MAGGEGFLTYYEAHKSFTNNMRNEIVKNIIFTAIKLNIKFDSRFYEKITEHIVETFENEKPETYYERSYINETGLRVAPRGKFIKRKSVELMKAGFTSSRSARSSDPKASTSSMCSDLPDESQERCRNWLLHKRIPWELVTEQWEKCYELRKIHFNGTKDLDELFSLYPILKEPKAAFLLRRDFERMYPGAEKRFNLSFPSLHEKLQSPLNGMEKGMNKANAQLYAEYKNETSPPDYKDYILVTLLPLLLPVNYRVRGKWRPSVAESQHSLILKVNTPADKRRVIEERIEYIKGKSGKPNLQPQIIMIGSPLEFQKAVFTVVFGAGEIPANNLQEALALVIISSFVLNLQYAPDNVPVWEFIQTFLFGISSGNRVSKGVLKLVELLK